MPIAFVLQLKCLEDGALYGLTGQHSFQYWREKWWGSELPTVGPRQETLLPEVALSLSPLSGASKMRHGRTPLLSGDVVEMRVAALSDEVGFRLFERASREIGQSISVGRLEWRIRSIEGPDSDHPDAGYETYGDLLRCSWEREDLPQQWELKLVTPTAVSVGPDSYMPFPLPRPLVESLWQRWNMLAPNPLPLDVSSIDEFAARYDDRLEITRYSLKAIGTSLFAHDTLPEAGCLGRVTLRRQKLDRAAAETLATLMRYSFYCGIGVYTSLGMGQTRIIRSL